MHPVFPPNVQLVTTAIATHSPPFIPQLHNIDKAVLPVFTHCHPCNSRWSIGIGFPVSSGSALNASGPAGVSVVWVHRVLMTNVTQVDLKPHLTRGSIHWLGSW
ncbi:hypothetical protein BD779DRAFT_1560057 [Infundibulicybe gibba]|nr:hypothetical protein BD779DRAFT_1560057 [Infundibulicybe gibba]